MALALGIGPQLDMVVELGPRIGLALALDMVCRLGMALALGI